MTAQEARQKTIESHPNIKKELNDILKQIELAVEMGSNQINVDELTTAVVFSILHYDLGYQNHNLSDSYVTIYW